ncbi:MAG: hypothetical protein AB1757_17680 [Acidobacteriota bacterium]
MKKLVIFIGLILTLGVTTYAQKSPSETVIKFYRALKDKKYVEGFHVSVYRGAIEGLTPAELKELEPDFARTFSEIPDKIDVKGEQINGETATVFLKFEAIEEFQQITLIRINGEWLVGDQESLTMVNQQGKNFFFNSRISVNEQEAILMLSRIHSSEIIYAQKFNNTYATLAELVKLQALNEDMADSESSGYFFAMTMSEDKTSYAVTATPKLYGKTGRISFYLDQTGILKGEDLQGKAATNQSPVFQPKNN